MSLQRLVPLLLAASLTVACAASLQTQVKSDPRADFSKFKTFQISGSRLETDAQASVSEEVKAHLEAKGLRPAADHPDLTVVIRLIRDAAESSDNSTYNWWTGGSTAEATTGLPVGTLAVDLVDPVRNQLVWRGVAKGTVPSNGTLLREKAKYALDRLFAEFPPKQSAS